MFFFFFLLLFSANDKRNNEKWNKKEILKIKQVFFFYLFFLFFLLSSLSFFSFLLSFSLLLLFFLFLFSFSFCSYTGIPRETVPLRRFQICFMGLYVTYLSTIYPKIGSIRSSNRPSKIRTKWLFFPGCCRLTRFKNMIENGSSEHEISKLFYGAVNNIWGHNMFGNRLNWS